MKYVKSIGVELEGAVPLTALPDDCENPTPFVNAEEHRDEYYPAIHALILSSLRYPERYYHDGSAIGGWGVENAIADEYKYWGNQKDVSEFLKLMYVKLETKTTSHCGFHMHLKVEKGMELTLGKRKVWEKFKEDYIRDFGKEKKYLDRISNGYCNGEYDNYLKNPHASKSLMFYLDVDKFETIEIRIMPNMNSYSEARKAVAWMIKEVELLGRLYHTSSKAKKAKRKVQKILTT